MEFLEDVDEPVRDEAGVVGHAESNPPVGVGCCEVVVAGEGEVPGSK